MAGQPFLPGRRVYGSGAPMVGKRLIVEESNSSVRSGCHAEIVTPGISDGVERWIERAEQLIEPSNRPETEIARRDDERRSASPRPKSG